MAQGIAHMGFSVNDFLGLPELTQYSVLTHGINLDEICIDCVSVLDYPAENWARKNELVLTTAASNPGKLDAFRDFVRDVVNSGASVLVITFENDMSVHIPESVIKDMEDAGVPLIVIPWKYRFSEIVEAVLDNVRYKGRRTVQNLEDFQKDLQLWVDKERLINDTKLTLLNDFIWSLATGDWSSWDTMLYRARLFGFDIALPYVCIAGRPGPAAGNRLSYDDGRSGWIMRHTARLLEAILMAANAGNSKVMVSFREDVLVMYLDVSRNGTESSVHRLLDRIDKDLGAAFPKIRFTWGISEISGAKTDFRQYYLNAKLALDICDNEKWPSRRNTYRDTSLYKVLLALSNNPDVAGMVWGVLGKLVQYEDEKGLGLIETYRAYMQNDYNVSRTAKEMHLHRQSLIYRLNKIMELTDCNLRNSEHRFLLELCTRLYMSFRFPHNGNA